MRVSIIGQAAFGEAVLKRLIEDGVEIVAASAPEPREGGRPDPLWVAAEEAGLTPIDTVALKEEAGLAAWRAAGAELGVMAFVTEILPEEALSAPEQGTIQYHPSLLPLHRGSSAMNWPIIFGRTETGLTIFWPDDGVDTGPVLLQKTCDIGPDDTLGSLYFERLFPMGVDAMAEAVKLVEAGDAPRIAQDHALSTYEPPCGKSPTPASPGTSPPNRSTTASAAATPSPAPGRHAVAASASASSTAASPSRTSPACPAPSSASRRTASTCASTAACST